MSDSLLDSLRDERVWERFYEYKTSLACPKSFSKELRAFIDRRGYLRVCDTIDAGEPFPLPAKSLVVKMSTQKKRVVYTYPKDENTVLKLLTYLLLRRYDGVHSPALWSFRPGRTAKDAVRSLVRIKDIGSMWAYKTDVSDYFNSVPVESLLPILERTVGGDPRLFAFLSSLLTEPCVLENGAPVRQVKGIMAGTPLASFYADLYLGGLDAQFCEKNVPYARYSDDIILFAETEDETKALAATVREKLKEAGLSVNPDKEEFSSPEEGWTFLGFHYRAGVVDLAPASLDKLKAKMRRKTRALERWRARGGLEREKAAAAFVRVFNRKLFDNPSDNELTWARWFFPVLDTADSLAVIDRYAQDCIRYLMSGTRTKARYDIRYADLKRLGYRSLVHEYYESKKVDGRSGDVLQSDADNDQRRP